LALRPAAGSFGRSVTERRDRLGSALLGRHVGDVVSIQDGGQIIRLEVVEIAG
jgi:transcription elongation GreA/GreB family factor